MGIETLHFEMVLQKNTVMGSGFELQIVFG
jgi:hypothetical protein